MPLPAAIAEFMHKHKVGTDEIWAVPGGRAYAVKHAALERIAFQNNIVFDPPQIVEADGANGIATMIVTGKFGDFTAWSIGEASPKNISQSPGGPLNGLRVRMWDKVARINNLIDTGKDAKNESLEDSFADLANYSIIALMVLKGKWPAE